MSVTAENEFKKVPAFEYVAYGDTEREKAFMLIQALESVQDLLQCSFYKELAEMSDEEEDNISNLQQEVVDELNGIMPMPPYCKVDKGEDSDWQVVPDYSDYEQEEMPSYEEVPEEYKQDVIMVVNDHGNVSCYSWNDQKREYEEEWAMV